MAASKVNFTKAIIDGLPVPESGKKRHLDGKVNGLAVLVTAGGSKAFYLYRRIGGKLYEQKIGACGDLSIEQARKKIEALIAEIHDGKDPSEARRKAKTDPTFGELFRWYMDKHGNFKKDKGEKDESQFRLHLQELAPLKANTIRRADVHAHHAKVHQEVGPVAANRMLALMKGVYNLAINLEAFGIVGNPAQGVKMAKEESRKRRLETREITRFLAAVEEESNEDIRDFILFALFTGGRKSNVLAMRWDQIDTIKQAWNIPGDEFKNGEAHTIPLAKQAQEILTRRRGKVKGAWVLPGPGKTGHMVTPRKGVLRAMERSGVQDITPHDLRRTLATFMAEAGVPENLIGLVLGHKPKSITGVYTRPSLEVLREAMEKGIERMYYGL